MIEVFIKKEETAWTLCASILPYGGFGIARDANLATLEDPTFQSAYESVTALSEVSFSRNPDRWPVPEPKFQIINQGDHSDREHFGNYHIRRNEQIVGVIENFQRGKTLELIKKALEILASQETS